MGIRRARAVAVATGLGLCLALATAAPAMADPGAIEGKVTEPEEAEGLAGIEVCAIAVTPGLDGDCVESEDGSGLGPRGHYEIPGLEPGEYKLRFTPPPESQYVYQYYFRKLKLENARAVEVESGGVAANKDATLEIGGRVDGTVTDITGVPLESVEVCVFDPAVLELGTYCTKTLANGRYEVLGLPGGSYVAHFLPDPARHLFGQYFTGKELLSEADRFGVLAGEETAGIDAEMETSVELEGTVTEAGTGVPLAGIGVCAFDAETELVEACTVSAPDGSYEIGELFPWEYVVGFSVAPAPGEGEDGFVRQYYEDKATFAEADVIEAFDPGFYLDIDAHLVRGPEAFPVEGTTPESKPSASNPPASSSAAALVTPPLVAPPLKCRKHFRPKVVKGKRRCVRVPHRRHHRRPPTGQGPGRPENSR